MINFANLDLNLLRTLEVLLTEHNVTRTAQKLHLSQPTVSVQLAKLRDIFDDPLLLPGSRGMKPTSLGVELHIPLQEALKSLEQSVISCKAFIPMESQKTWTFAASDYSEFTIIQPVMKSIYLQAPKSRISVVQMLPNKLVKQSENGEIDLTFQTRDYAPPDLRSRKLFTERYVLVGRTGHPLLHSDITVNDFCKLKHVIVSPNGNGFFGPTDEKLRKLGLKRNVVLSVPHFHFVVSVIKDSDLVAMLPERLIKESKGLQITLPPIDLPTFDIIMLWHERAHNDPAHKWLRDQVVQLY